MNDFIIPQAVWCKGEVQRREAVAEVAGKMSYAEQAKLTRAMGEIGKLRGMGTHSILELIMALCNHPTSRAAIDRAIEEAVDEPGT